MTVLLLIKAAAALALFLGVTLITVSSFDRASGPAMVYWLRYTGYLNGTLKPVKASVTGAQFATAQAAGLFVVVVALLALEPAAWVVVPALLVPTLLPIVFLKRAGTARSEAIDLGMPDFMLSFANALRVTPSIGGALAQVSQVQTGPIADELKTAVQELRVGTGIEQIFYNMSSRMNSLYADSAFTGVLIGRQVGGNIPDILESTAETIRELERLHGVLRTKTAEAKGQIYVMACTPPVVGIGYEFMNPGHFDPFFHSTRGMVIFAGALLAWIVGVMIARAMVNVEF